MPVMLSKQILKPGTYYPTGDDPVVVTPERIQHWADTFKKMSAAGMHVPVPLSHSKPGDPNYAPIHSAAKADYKPGPTHGGWLKDLRADDSGWLVADMDIDDPETAKKVEFFSPAIASGFTDGAGRTWNDAITHMAAVYHQVAHDQPEGFTQPPKMMGVVCLSIRDFKEPAMPKKLELMAKLGGLLKAAMDQHPNKVQLMANLPPAANRAMWAKVDAAGGKRTKDGQYDDMDGEWALSDEASAQALSLAQQLVDILSGGDGTALPGATEPEAAPLPDTIGAAGMAPAMMSIFKQMGVKLDALTAKTAALEAAAAKGHRADIKARLENVKRSGAVGAADVDVQIAAVDTALMSLATDGTPVLAGVEQTLKAWEQVIGNPLTTALSSGYNRNATPAPLPAGVGDRLTQMGIQTGEPSEPSRFVQEHNKKFNGRKSIT